MFKSQSNLTFQQKLTKNLLIWFILLVSIWFFIREYNQIKNPPVTTTLKLDQVIQGQKVMYGSLEKCVYKVDDEGDGFLAISLVESSSSHCN